MTAAKLKKVLKLLNDNECHFCQTHLERAIKALNEKGSVKIRIDFQNGIRGVDKNKLHIFFLDE